MAWLQSSTEGRKAAIEIMPNDVHRFAKAKGNLVGRKSFIIRHLNNRPATRPEFAQNFLCETRHFQFVAGECATETDGQRGFKLCPAVEMIGNKMPLSVQSTMISILQNPHLKHALARVKIGRRPENIEENSLDHILRLAGVAYDSKSDAENQAMIAVKQNRKGIGTSRCHILHKLGIIELP